MCPVENSSEVVSSNNSLLNRLHSYSKPAPADVSVVNGVESHSNLKRVKALRYLGDLTEDNYATPQGAKVCWSIARRLIEKRNEKILHCRKENEILERRLKNLKEVILQLRRTGSIPAKYRKAGRSSNSAAQSRIHDRDASPNWVAKWVFSSLHQSSVTNRKVRISTHFISTRIQRKHLICTYVQTVDEVSVMLKTTIPLFCKR
jgi:hypothetical protein